ncbi:hypothetical protein [Parahaliea mediterranea]|uniref:Uncharacterized protein n=1 Tax=Parahaliea mediterranea TaxID=651086 RepID=A0A939DBA8_9GAMM|nr:hypothetical protein [Parahaliea mediterranea]MBN7795005.1 hypothetical protein [Parahaliea mediterranea]
MSSRINIDDLSLSRDLDRRQQAGIRGGVAEAFLFMRPPARPQAPVFNQFVSIDTFEVNNYETHNYIDRLINQTVNQNQLNLVSVESGGGSVSVSVDQAQAGSNANI